MRSESDVVVPARYALFLKDLKARTLTERIVDKFRQLGPGYAFVGRPEQEGRLWVLAVAGGYGIGAESRVVSLTPASRKPSFASFS